MTGGGAFGLKEAKATLPGPQRAHPDPGPPGELTNPESHPFKVNDLYKKYKDSSTWNAVLLDSCSNWGESDENLPRPRRRPSGESNGS